MSTGVLEHTATRVKYCLIPEKPTERDGLYFEDGPPLRDPQIDDQGRLHDPTRKPIDSSIARPVRESDLWSSGDFVATVKDWPVYPFATKLHELLPADLLDEVVKRTQVRKGSGVVEFGVNWDGLSIQKRYKLLELPIGVGAWPARILPGWGQYFFVFGPGTMELANNRVPLFQKWEPSVYGFAGGTTANGGIVRSETCVVDSNRGAICRLSVPPRWLSFRDAESTGGPCGVMPILQGPDDQLQMPHRDHRKSTFALRQVSGTNPEHRVRVAVDFGTSNTAVAFGSGLDDIRKLSFSDFTRAANLTEAVGLNPVVSSRMGLRCFPFDFTLASPLPTVLMEFDEAAPHFSESGLFPRYAIPGIVLDAGQIQAFRGSIRQDFKWKDSGGGPDHRRAYLEQLALLIGCELRSRENPVTDLTVVYTGPLAFSTTQINRLRKEFDDFKDVLKSCGFRSVVKEASPISESHANYRFARNIDHALTTSAVARQVVIDIGGGTTDISVFTGMPHVGSVLLDSLYIGGKDIAASLLRHRVETQNRWENVAKLLNTDYKPTGRADVAWTEIMQLLLINRMAEPGGEGVAKLARDLESNDMRDLMGEVGVLMVFVTLYALRMAAAPRPEIVVKEWPKGLPPAEEIDVLYVGQGSKLFDLYPLHHDSRDSWTTAKSVIVGAAKQFPELQHTKLRFKRLVNQEKESVSVGALHESFKPSSESKSDDTSEYRPPNPFKLRTVWWASSRLGEKDVLWTDIYDKKEVAKLGDAGRRALRTDALNDCLTVSVERVGRSTFEEDWVPKPDVLAEAKDELPKAFGTGCYELERNPDGAAEHPVRLVTDVMKKHICELIEK